MFRNYIITAWRNIRRNVLSGAISILCLAVGLSGAVIMTIYLNHELAYDTHYEDHERIFRMEGIYKMAGTSYHMAITPFPLALAMELEYSELESYARFFVADEEVLVRIGEDEFHERDVVYADSTVFDVFSHKFIYGSPKGALSEPNTIVLTRALSEKYYGAGNPVGQSLEVGNNHYMVTGVIEDLPSNTHFRYNALRSMSTAGRELVYTIDPELFWNINLTYTYVKVHRPDDMDRIMERMPEFTAKYVAPMGDTMGASTEYRATALRDTHFQPLMMAPEAGNKNTLLIFSLVALFLVIIAAINYTNLATARAAARAREIGIRKTAGASRSQLVFQFLSESMLTAVIAMVLSLLIIELLLPAFNAVTGNAFRLGDIIRPGLLLQVAAITLITGLAAGIYPAMVLSRLAPAITVKGQTHRRHHSGVMRKILVIFQFTISIILVSGTMTVQSQLGFLNTKSLGFQPDNSSVVSVQGSGPRRQIATLEQRILQNPDVVRTSKAFSVPGNEHNVNAIKIEGEGEMRDAVIAVNYIDEQFMDHLGIEIIEGRGFDPEMRTDVHRAVVINETAARQFGWQDDPVGKRIYMHFDQEGNPQQTLRVIGVFRDYHFLSLANPVDPMMMFIPENPAQFRYVIATYADGATETVNAFLKNEMLAFDPSVHPEITSLRHGFREAFEREERQSKLFGFFAIITIIISFVGLFGLSSYMINQRKKEIGIRKVLGSSMWNVALMLYKEYVRLILIAVLIAAPVSWWLMSLWLEQFVFHMDMSLQPVLFASLIAIIIAVLTVSYHSARAANIQPVSTLRAE